MNTNYKERAPIYVGRMKVGFIIMLIFIAIEVIAAILSASLHHEFLAFYFGFLGPFTIAFTLSFIWIYFGQMLAAQRNRDPAIWGILFLFFGVWALIALLLLGEDTGEKNTATTDSFKNFTTSSQIKSEMSTADALLKYKELLDKGVITQEEFDKKKAELL